MSSHKVVLHGSLAWVNGRGILFTGESGSGKSSSCLRLVEDGHCLVADDVIQAVRTGNKLIGRAPDGFERLFEIRGVGIVDIAACYGPNSHRAAAEIGLVVELSPYEQIGINYISPSAVELLGVVIPRLRVVPRSRIASQTVRSGLGSYPEIFRVISHA